MQEFLPKLHPIDVDPNCLFLDPNNPRFVSSKDERVPDDQIGSPRIVSSTFRKMFPGEKDDPYRIVELVHSIQTNGWQPVDSIFVRKYGNSGHYVVLEGNRRVTAIQHLLGSEDVPESVTQSLASIEVMEVLGESDPDELERQISYLLGVRHHGSLKRWSPFAQASNIFDCFMEKAGLSKTDEFNWDETIGRDVADALSVPLKGKRSIEERLSVFQAMKSVATLPSVGAEKIKDHYFSLFNELLSRKKQKLGRYISQDPETFLLGQESAQRMENLCHFTIPKRQGAPIVNPQEWRSLNEILSDKDDEKRAWNLRRVEEEKEKPSVVWAQRKEELKRLEWSVWLEKVYSIVQKIQLGQIETSDAETKNTVKRLIDLLDELSESH